MQTLRKVLDLLTPRERWQALLLLGMVIVMAFLDVVGVAFIMPFISVWAHPEVIQKNAYLKSIYDTLGFTTAQHFLIFLGAALFVMQVLAISFKALTTWATLRFTYMREYSIARRLVVGYLHQPYEWFLSKHSADLGRTVMAEVVQATNGTLVPLMTLVAKGAVALALLALLVVADPVLSLGLGATLLVAYGGVLTLAHQRLRSLGADRSKMLALRFRSLSEAFGGIKDIKVGGMEEIFFRRYDGPAKSYAKHQVKAQLAKSMPRFIIDAVAFGAMIVLLLYLLSHAGSVQQALPVAALFALAGYRLNPQLHGIYTSLATLRYSGTTLDNLHRDLMELQPASDRGPAPQPLRFVDSVELRGVTYQYPAGKRPVLENFNLAIPACTTVGLVGSTGSGKTTTADLILGILTPQQGELRVDGQPISAANRRAWQRAVGYVPQQIYLSDDSIGSNIAFGVAPAKVDRQALENAARIAQLHDFVTQELPQGYDTRVGERGVRLSGGQRQRIGIARALYHRPQLLVLDEATAALDNLTEQAVMDAVRKLHHEITIIIIAHRLSTLRDCDQIFLLEDGKLMGQGGFDELLRQNARFRAMAEAASTERAAS